MDETRCDNPAIERVPARLIVEHDVATGHCRWRVEGEFPSTSLVMMLEMIKTHLVIQQLETAAQQALSRVQPATTMPPASVWPAMQRRG